MSTYTYSLSSDFGGNINTTQFHSEINNDPGIFPNLEGINTLNDDVDIIFDSSLSAGEQTTLTGLVSSHTAVATSKIGTSRIFKEEKSNATNGGTFTSGSWQTRSLNISIGNMLGTSLSSNQFTLQTGQYHIEGNAIGYRVDDHQTRIYNITDTLTEFVGSSSHADCSDSIPGATPSFFSGDINITASKTFELQHRCQTTQTIDGLGRAVGFGETEIYASVKVTKL